MATSLADWGRGCVIGRDRRIEAKGGGEGGLVTGKKRSLHEFPDRWATKLLRPNRVTE